MREKTKYIGVYARKHSTRRHLGRQDICYDITYKDATGKKIWIKIGWISEGVTAAMAHATRAEKMREQRDIPSYALPNTQGQCITFAEAFTIYARDHLPKVKHPAFAFKQYKYVSPTLGEIPLDKMTAYDIDKLISSMQAEGYSAQTIKHAVGIIKRVYRKLIAWDMYHGKIPTDNISLPRIDSTRERYLTPEEASLLLHALKKKSETWHDIAYISLHTGMRIGEILNLQWQDIDLNNKTLFIREAKAGSRTVLLTDAATHLLMQRKQDHVGIVFPTKTGKPSFAVSKTFSRCVEALGLNAHISDRRQRVVFHTLRHTFASWLAIKGIPLYVISQLLGHKSLEMTQRYAHLCPDAKREAITLLNNVLNHESSSAT